MKLIQVATQLEHIDRHIVIYLIKKDYHRNEQQKQECIQQLISEKESRVEEIMKNLSTKEGIEKLSHDVYIINTIINSNLLAKEHLSRFSKRLEDIQKELEKRIKLM